MLTCAAVASEHALALPLPLPLPPLPPAPDPLLLLLPPLLPLLPPLDVSAERRRGHGSMSVAHTLAVGGCPSQCERQLARGLVAWRADKQESKDARRGLGAREHVTQHPAPTNVWEQYPAALTCAQLL